MAKLKTAAKAPEYRLPELVHVSFFVQASRKDADERTEFDPPVRTRASAANILVEDHSQIQAAIDRIAGLQAGETAHVSAVRVVQAGVHTVVSGYDKKSTGADPVPSAKPSKKRKRK